MLHASFSESEQSPELAMVSIWPLVSRTVFTVKETQNENPPGMFWRHPQQIVDLDRLKASVLHKNSELDGVVIPHMIEWVEGEVSRYNYHPSRNPKRVLESAVSLK